MDESFSKIVPQKSPKGITHYSLFESYWFWWFCLGLILVILSMFSVELSFWYLIFITVGIIIILISLGWYGNEMKNDPIRNIPQ